MRINTSITEAEQNAYNAFCQQHNITNDQSVEGIRNAEFITAYIVDAWKQDITLHTLQVALEKLHDILAFIPAEQIEVMEILGRLDQAQRDTVARWLSHQHRLETEGVGGFSNVSVVVSWVLNRNFEVSEHNLTTALTNSMNNGHRKIYWKESAKQDRSIGPGGKINHALVNKSDEGFMPRSQTNRSYRQMMEENRPKSETTTPPAVHDDLKARAESVVGRTHAQTDQARKLFAVIPGTTTIDWEATLAMRQRFVNKQAVLVRR
jgi:hypothetical protein